jgi:hypothetical protein
MKARGVVGIRARSRVMVGSRVVGIRVEWETRTGMRTSKTPQTQGIHGRVGGVGISTGVAAAALLRDTNREVEWNNPGAAALAVCNAV